MLGSKEGVPESVFKERMESQNKPISDSKPMPVRSEWTMDMPALQTKSRNQDQNDSNILSSDVSLNISHHLGFNGAYQLTSLR